MRGSAVGKHFDKAVTKHVCAKALDQAVHEGWLIEDVNYVRARPNQETPIHCQFVSDVLSHVRLVGLSLASRCRAFVAQPLVLTPRVTQELAVQYSCGSWHGGHRGKSSAALLQRGSLCAHLVCAACCSASADLGWQEGRRGSSN